MSEYLVITNDEEIIGYYATKEDAILSAKEYIGDYMYGEDVDTDEGVKIYELVCHTKIIKSDDDEDFVAIVEEDAE